MDKSEKKSETIPSKIVTVVMFILLFCGFVLCGFLAFKLLTEQWTKYEGTTAIDVLNLDTRPISEKEKDEYIVAPDRPRFLRIESIGVKRARVIEVGLFAPNEDGIQQMQAPNNTSDVGWFNCLKNPNTDKRCKDPVVPGGGDTENAAIIDAHTCFSTSIACVFDNLRSLKIGSIAEIEMGDGTKIKYIVKRVEVVDLEDVDMAALGKPIEPGTEGLNFISCAGKYEGATDANGALTASQRVLVWAVRE